MKKILLLLMMTTSMLIAQPRWNTDEDDDHPMPRDGHEMMMNRLNLTEEQQKQFEQLQLDVRKSEIALRSKLQTSRLDLGALFRNNKPDRAMIETKIGEIGKIQTDMKMTRLGFWFSVNNMLTPDQQKLWKHHLGMMGKEKMNQRRGMGMRRPHLTPGDRSPQHDD